MALMWGYPASLAQSQSQPQPAGSETQFFVVVGSFADIGNAQQLSSSFGAMSYATSVEVKRVNRGDYFRVLVGPFPDQLTAERARYDIELAGIASGYIEQKESRAAGASAASGSNVPENQRTFSVQSVCENRPNQSLPAEAQMRVLNARARNAVLEKDYAKVLDIFELMDCVRHPRALKLFLTEAQLAKEAGDHLRAIGAVENYLQRADGQDPDYDAAIAMFVELDELVPADARDGDLERIAPEESIPSERGKAKVSTGGMNGKPTANGEIIDETAMTAAHPSLPLPSLVQVINEDNGREIVVRVNDRGPFDGKHILELSPHASSVLGMKDGQPANVVVNYLGPPPMESN